MKCSFYVHRVLQHDFIENIWKISPIWIVKSIHFYIRVLHNLHFSQFVWGWVQLILKLTVTDVSWKYPQIVSIEDCAKHCFKNEWTLNICKSKWFLIMVLMVCFILVFLMDLMVTCVIFALFYRPQASLPKRILDKSNRKAPTKWYNLKVGRKVVVFFFCLYLLWPSFIIEEARLGLG